MNALKIDQDKCTLCGTCEISLPSLLTKAKDSTLFISNSNLKRHAVKVYRAIFSCREKALTLGVAQ